MNLRLIRSWVAAFSVLLAAAGCNDNSTITVYRVPKETNPEASPPEQAAMNPAGAPVHWKAPDGWEEQPASGFRKGSFVVRGSDKLQADVSIISFPETAGGLLANVNRWRGQLKLAPVTDVATVAQSIPVSGHQVFFTDMVSDEPVLDGGLKSRILGGILELDGETWFFKMSGEDKLVASQREAFRQFLEGLEIASATAVTSKSTNAPPPPLVEAPAAEKPALRYQLPSGWQEQALSPMRAASFKVTGQEGHDADVSVVSLSGMAGGDLANVNRWRGQLTLGPIDEQALAQSSEHVKANGHDFLVVDLASEAPIGQPPQKTRILAAILNEGERSWFVKMTGEDTLVASQKNAFTTFLRSLTIP